MKNNYITNNKNKPKADTNDLKLPKYYINIQPVWQRKSEIPLVINNTLEKPKTYDPIE